MQLPIKAIVLNLFLLGTLCCSLHHFAYILCSNAGFKRNQLCFVLCLFLHLVDQMEINPYFLENVYRQPQTMIFLIFLFRGYAL